MPVNPYFNNYKKHSEQTLLEDLVIESIKMYGYEFVYLPRQFRKLDIVYGEDVISKFDKSYEMEMYIKSVDNYGGDGDYLSKFGLEIRDRAILVVAVRRFDQTLNGEIQRPNEGDLIYFDLDKKLFEVKFVEDKSVFFQLGQLYVYEITVEAYQFSHEEFNTGIGEIDEISEQYQSSQLLNLVSFTGTFNKGDTIYQGPDLMNATAKAAVAGFDAGDNTLIIQKITGQFTTANGTITGPVGTALLDNVDELIQQNSTDNSKNFEVESQSIIDWSEDNPFSEDDG